MVVAIEKKVQQKAKKVFKYRGSLDKCATETGIHRTTIPRIIANGRGEQAKVERLTKYIKSVKVA